VTTGCTPTCAGKGCGASDGCSGTCGTGSCPGGQICQNGECVLWCDAGFTQCGSQCVDTQTNASHCGGCNQPCAVEDPETCGTNGQCVGGTCQEYDTSTVCRAPSCMSEFTAQSLAVCDGNGTCPSSVQQDCAPYKCRNGSCRWWCSSHDDCIDSHFCGPFVGCSPLKNDGEICFWVGDSECQSGYCVGGVCCSTRCNPPPHARPTCPGGTCGFVCDAGWDDCDGDPANGCEINLSLDEDHCGTCGNRCPTTICGDPSEPRFWACVEGSCECVI
jgi:hypothetical protein